MSRNESPTDAAAPSSAVTVQLLDPPHRRVPPLPPLVGSVSTQPVPSCPAVAASNKTGRDPRRPGPRGPRRAATRNSRSGSGSVEQICFLVHAHRPSHELTSPCSSGTDRPDVGRRSFRSGESVTTIFSAPSPAVAFLGAQPSSHHFPSHCGRPAARSPHPVVDSSQLLHRPPTEPPR